MSAVDKWWKEAAVYQIYPASFYDSNGDGWGDLPGITVKLPYLRQLGVDALWICPFYDSPQQDMGYDISDYEKVWPRYGTNEDCYQLIREAHAAGIRVVVDLVINHCSSEHAWFRESRSSKTSAKRDWFIWRPAKGFTADGKPIPPNNWQSFFGGSAWEWDERTQEFYLRLFASGQPDFNWELSEVREAIYESAAGFWLDHGVDGFRIDTAGLYSKIEGLPDAEVRDATNEHQHPGHNTQNGPRIHEFHKEMRAFFDKRTAGRADEIFTVGEVGRCDLAGLLQYTSEQEREMSQLFNFAHTECGVGTHLRYHAQPFTLKEWKLGIAASFLFANRTDSWSTVYLENHDQPRSVTRFGDDSPAWRQVSAKLLAILEVALTGTLYVYQGQELGQINNHGWTLDQYQDVDMITNRDIIAKRYGENSVEMAKFAQGVALLSRDHSRTPFPWTSREPDASFSAVRQSGVKPWISMNDSFRDGINAEDELKDPNSVFHFWRAALRLRKQHKDILVYGQDFEFLDLDNPDLFMFTKKSRDGAKTLFAALNFSSEDREFPLPDEDAAYKAFFGNYDLESAQERTLRPWEGRLFYVE